MNKETINMVANDKGTQINITVASFRNLQSKDPIKNAVIYFWESHTNNPDDKKRTNATIDLIYKKFDVASCEKYEIRTGYLSRYNYLHNPKDESTIDELETAIERGEEEQNGWIQRCDPKLPGFVQRNWQSCISRSKNPHFEKCKKLLIEHVKNEDAFKEAFSSSVDNYISKRSVNVVNSHSYLIEENAWILTLPLLHPDKQIYIIHVGNITDSTQILFTRFSYLREGAKLLIPTFSNERFDCVGDFVVEYKNKRNYGYSHPVDDDKIVNFVSPDDSQLSADVLLKMLLQERSEKEILSSVISKMPGHIYWLNKNGVYLGCNDLQAQTLGLSSRDKIVGKTNYDLLPEMEAKRHSNINRMVMDRGTNYSGQETSSMQDGKFSYLSHKAPLFNSSRTKVIGLLGISIDITDRIMVDEERRRTKELKFQNKLQEVRLKTQEEFKDFISMMAHDIVSPLVNLSFIMKSCQDLSEEQQVSLNNTITEISSVANVLLNRYKQDIQDNSIMHNQYVMVPLALLEVLYHKRREYQHKDVEISYTPDSRFNFSFIKGNQNNFQRMLSNLVNNSVDSFKGKPGVVVLSLNGNTDYIIVKVKDNGIGMPKDMVARILSDNFIGTTKSAGNGIGLNQVRTILDLYDGNMTIDSVDGVGTTITLVFPKAIVPNVMLDKLVVSNGSTVVVLDKNESLEKVWTELFRKYMVDIKFKFFSNTEKAASFINSLPNKNNICLIVDYELGSKNAGLRFILDNGMTGQIVACNIHNDPDVLELIESCGMKMIPKQYITDIPIIVE
jgi:PAS domain S-box-containing protein